MPTSIDNGNQIQHNFFFFFLNCYYALNCNLELRSLSIVPEETMDECSPREGSEEETESETATSNVSTSDSEPRSNGKSDSQWRGFLRKLKKGPAMHLHTFHPTIPHLPSIKKRSTRKERNTQSLPRLSPGIDSEMFYCFEASWKNFSLSDLQEATNNFSSGM